jgi:hypothetical protein
MINDQAIATAQTAKSGEARRSAAARRPVGHTSGPGKSRTTAHASVLVKVGRSSVHQIPAMNRLPANQNDPASTVAAI